jgi:sec-independent protein translocase protein TatC
MRSYRRHAIVVILVLAAVITPPDVVDQLIVFTPLYLLYEISIFISKKALKGMDDTDRALVVKEEEEEWS